MAKETFGRALELVLAHEGGYVNHPKDPGGATNRGVTQRVYDAWRKAHAGGLRSVRHITEGEVRAIYRAQYWDAVHGDELPAGIDYCVFDAAVNSGPARAAKWLQQAVGVAADGIVGQMTIAAAIETAAIRGAGEVIADICARRMAFVRSLKTWKTFGRGWTRRIMGDRDGAQTGDHGVIDYATEMGRWPGPSVIDPPFSGRPAAIGAKPGETAGRADPADIDHARSPEAVGGGLAGLGTAGAVLLEMVPRLQALGDGGALKAIVAAMIVAGVALTVWSALRNRREAAV